MNLVISESVRAKLHAKHGVSPKDVRECFENRTGGLLEDVRDQHRSDPPTLWFIAANNQNRLLKVCFVLRDGTIFLRTCYSPNEAEISTYQAYGSSP